MKLCESCLLVDNVPEENFARYEVDPLASPRILRSKDSYTCVKFDSQNILNEKGSSELKCVFSMKDGAHSGEVLVPILKDIPDEKYDEMFVKMLDDCGEENGVSEGKFTTIAARRELINECIMKVEEHNLIATNIIIHPSLESKFKKALQAQDMDESYLVLSEYVPENVFYVTPPRQYLGVVAKKKEGTGISIINDYSVAKAKIIK